jgi:hypothetical protein
MSKRPARPTNRTLASTRATLDLWCAGEWETAWARQRFLGRGRFQNSMRLIRWRREMPSIFAARV